jgi:uncharacterized protein (TIGR03067 family)
MGQRFILIALLIGVLVAADKPKATDKKADDPAAAEMKKLEGSWKLVRKEFRGNLQPPAVIQATKPGIFLEDGKIVWTTDGKEAGGQTGDFTLDPAATPKAIDVEITRGSFIGKKMLGIYELKGDKLSVCWNDPGSEKRPKKFVTKVAVGSGVIYEIYQKIKE